MTSSFLRDARKYNRILDYISTLDSMAVKNMATIMSKEKSTTYQVRS